MSEFAETKPQIEVVHEDVVRDFLTWAQEHRDIMHSIAIMVPIRPGDNPDVELTNMMSIWQMAGITIWNAPSVSGGFLEAVRCGMAWHFLNDTTHSEQKFCIMIDSDMCPSGKDIWLPYLLTRHDKPVVGGCAITLPGSDYGPSLCFTVKDVNGDYRLPMMDGLNNIMPKTGLIEVGHCGTGLLCIRRDVFEAFSWTDDTDKDPDGLPFFIPDKLRKQGYKICSPGRGEDIEFSAQVRRKGFTIHVDLEAHIGHRKPATLRWFDSLRDPQMKASSWVVPAAGVKINP